MELNNEMAQWAWALGPVSKKQIPHELLLELIDDFCNRHPELVLLDVEELEGYMTYTVYFQGEERLSLHEDWLETFESHGYEAPVPTFTNEVPLAHA